MRDSWLLFLFVYLFSLFLQFCKSCAEGYWFKSSLESWILSFVSLGSCKLVVRSWACLLPAASPLPYNLMHFIQLYQFNVLTAFCGEWSIKIMIILINQFPQNRQITSNWQVPHHLPMMLIIMIYAQVVRDCHLSWQQCFSTLNSCQQSRHTRDWDFFTIICFSSLVHHQARYLTCWTEEITTVLEMCGFVTVMVMLDKSVYSEWVRRFRWGP